MNKQTFFIVKITLLYISFKVLYLDIKNEIYQQIKLYDNSNFINNNNFSCIDEIKLIFVAYQLSQNNIIQKNAYEITKAYNNNENRVLNKKYLNKFKYLYYSALSYYKYSNLNLNYYSVAVLNLYIITKCYKNKNIFFLIKYLYAPSYF
uniref:Uncharacterized protein n=1 Tax=Caloglossa monosticha TaxID=76906 RepID=A0A1Z1M501_9FLOR|nr:hypothetical protein [Caloglossa monosticha]ARW61138.1 hypothetical protein [Caloglossa monosticha]